MRRTSLAAFACIAAMLASPAAMAQDDAWHTYVGGGYQSLSPSYKSLGSALLPGSLSQGLDVHVGERFGTYYAAEVGYMSSEDSRNFTVLTLPYTSKVTVSGPTLDAYGFLPLWHSAFSLVGTAGVSYLDGKAKISGPMGSVSAGKSEFGYRAGGGIEWRPVEHFGVAVLGRYQSADFSGVANHAFVGSVGFNVYF